MVSSGARTPGARPAEALDFDCGLVNGESVPRNLSYKALHDGALTHFVDMTAVVAYCKDRRVMPMTRVGTGHVGIHRFQSVCETISHQSI
jgi:hypothetical protein